MKTINDRAEVQEANNVAEASLLGAILITASYGTRDEIQFALDRLKPAMFNLDIHKRIFEAMSSCQGMPNQVVVAQRLKEMGKLRGDDCWYLRQLVAGCPCSLDLKYYLKAVINGRT